MYNTPTQNSALAMYVTTLAMLQRNLKVLFLIGDQLHLMSQKRFKKSLSPPFIQVTSVLHFQVGAHRKELKLYHTSI